ncbi:phosphoribosyltransferase [Nocardia huaxiensis]|uniref:Phosphoribosyltransferase n=1 Tax=Nocardia huaxiensis TaxID=2755382 RepID=A0A7D6Z0R0_9NOCA|nr:phosphoribosyltransferase [Nocardia huaxiensis]QLY29546.1 phosphoribosyltransferase [Nocardia huaxiensis]
MVETGRAPGALFADRQAAGRQLALRLPAFRGPDVLLAGLPVGGVEIACTVADFLRVQVDALVLQELRAAEDGSVYGAIVEDGVRALELETALYGLRTTCGENRTESGAVESARRRAQLLRCGRDRAVVARRTVVIVADALARTVVVRAAVRSVYARGAVRVAVAAPVGSADVVAALSDWADKVVCLHILPGLDSPDSYYEVCEPATDVQIGLLLAQHASELPGTHPANL